MMALGEFSPLRPFVRPVLPCERPNANTHVQTADCARDLVFVSSTIKLELRGRDSSSRQSECSVRGLTCGSVFLQLCPRTSKH
jgi:hypothetical protein